MSVASFDKDRHHVGLGEDADDLFGLLIEGAYRRNLQPMPTPQAFGGTTDYLNNPVLARWTQEDFSGGSFNYQWGVDNKMFAYCTSMLPVLDAKTVRTVPPIVAESAKNDQSTILLSLVFGNTLVIVRPTVVQRYDLAARTWGADWAIPGSGTTPATTACYDRAEDNLYVWCNGKIQVLSLETFTPPSKNATCTISNATPAVVTLTAHGLAVDDRVFFSVSDGGALPTGLTAGVTYYVVAVPTADTLQVSDKKGGAPLGTTSAGSGTFTAWTKYAGATGTVPGRFEYVPPSDKNVTSLTGLIPGKAFLGAISDKNRLLTLQLPVDKGLDAQWTDVTRVPGRYRAHVTFNGVTYLLLADGFNATSVISFDGSNLLPITDFPYNFEGKCITAYGGRVYVAGSGRDLSGIQSYPELYEITGSTLRLIRTFTPEARDGGEVTPFANCTTIRSIAVHEGLLHLGFDGYGLMAYDLVTDSLYGSSRFQDTGVANAQIWALITGNQTLNVWVDSSVPGKRGLYRVAALGQDVDPYAGTLVTSDFGPQPEASKRWSTIHLVTRYGGVDIEYSTDGGTTYTNVAAEQTVEGSYIHTVADLTALPISKRIRFRFTFPRTSDSASYTELVAFTLGFLFLASGKKVWSFSVNGAERVQRAEVETTEVQAPSEIASKLVTWAEGRAPLIFRDLDGSLARVNITNFSDFKPVVGPLLDDRVSREGFYALTLTEV
jgi:hypothetical protein